MWTTCKYTRSKLPLLVGGELDPAAAHKIRRHLATCAKCARHADELGTTQQVLETARRATRPPARKNLWHDLQRRIGRPSAQETTLVGWVPVGVLAAACLAVYLLGSGIVSRWIESDGVPVADRPSVQFGAEAGRSAAAPDLLRRPFAASQNHESPFVLKNARPVSAVGRPQEF